MRGGDKPNMKRRVEVEKGWLDVRKEGTREKVSLRKEKKRGRRTWKEKRGERKGGGCTGEGKIGEKSSSQEPRLPRRKENARIVKGCCTLKKNFSGIKNVKHNPVSQRKNDKVFIIKEEKN